MHIFFSAAFAGTPRFAAYEPITLPTSPERRHWLVAVLLVVCLLVASHSSASALTATPSCTEGPYYTFSSQNEVVQSGTSYYASQFFTTEGTDNDLTHIYSSSTQCSGTLFLLSGTLVNTAGTPISGATIEIWEADNNGVYWYVSNSSGTNNFSGRDKNFQGYGKTTTDSSGAWSFRTIKPGLYTGRIRHFHVKVDIGGTNVLTTQYMFSEDSASFSSDSVAASLVRAGTMSLVTLTPTSGTDSSGNTALIASNQLVINYTVATTTPTPTITKQPSSETVSLGGNAAFSVTATNASSYQWYKGYTAISGATGSTYTINSATADSAGSYDVVVTNSAGSVTSNTATLTVNGSNSTAVVNIKAAGDATLDTSGDFGKVVFTRSGGDTTSELSVTIKVKGTAADGTDYTEADGSSLGTTVTFPAGTSKMKIKLVGKSDGVAGSTKTVVVKLVASSDGSYVVGNSSRAKLTLIDNEQ